MSEELVPRVSKETWNFHKRLFSSVQSLALACSLVSLLAFPRSESEDEGQEGGWTLFSSATASNKLVLVSVGLRCVRVINERNTLAAT